MRIPSWESSMQSGALPQVYEQPVVLPTQTGSEALGKGLSQLGEGIVSAGTAWQAYEYQKSSREARAAELADHTAVLKAMNKLNAVYQSATLEFERSAGEDAVKQSEAIYDLISREREQIKKENIANQRQTDLFDIEADKGMHSVVDRVERKLNQQLQITMEAQEEIAVKNAMDAAFVAPKIEDDRYVLDPEQIEHAFSIGEKGIEQRAYRMRWSKDQKERALQDLRNSLFVSGVRGLMGIGAFLEARQLIEGKKEELRADYPKVIDEWEKAQDQYQRKEVAGAYARAFMAWQETNDAKKINEWDLFTLKDPYNPHAPRYYQDLLERIRQDEEARKRALAGLGPPPQQVLAWIDFQAGMATQPEFYQKMDRNTFVRLLSTLPPKKREKAIEDRTALLAKGAKEGVGAESLSMVVLQLGREYGKFPKVTKGGVNINQPSTWPEKAMTLYYVGLEEAERIDREERGANRQRLTTQQLRERLKPLFITGTIPAALWGEDEITQLEARAQGRSDEWRPPQMTTRQELEIRSALAAENTPITPANIREAYFRRYLPKSRWGRFQIEPEPVPPAAEPYGPEQEISPQGQLRKMQIEGANPPLPRIEIPSNRLIEEQKKSAEEQRRINEENARKARKQGIQITPSEEKPR